MDGFPKYSHIYRLSATPLGLFLVVSSSSVVAIFIDDAVATDHPKTLVVITISIFSGKMNH